MKLLEAFNRWRSLHADKITHAAIGYVGTDMLAAGAGVWIAAAAVLALQIVWESIGTNTRRESALDTLATAAGICVAVIMNF